MLRCNLPLKPITLVANSCCNLEAMFGAIISRWGGLFDELS